MSKLNFTIGLPRSGKSTFCKKWKGENNNRVVLSGDSFRFAVYNKRYQREGEELVRATLITAARALLLDGYEVLIDDTNTTISSIEQILMINKNAGAVLFHTPIEICKQRAIDCSQDDLVLVINRLTNNMKNSKEFILRNVNVLIEIGPKFYHWKK